MSVNPISGNISPPGNNNHEEMKAVPVILSTKNAPPAEEADALLSSLGYSKADLDAYQERYGVNLRQQLVDTFTANHRAGRFNPNAGQRFYDAATKSYKVKTYIGVNESFLKQLTGFIAERRNPAAQPNNAAAAEELNAYGAERRNIIEAKLPLAEVTVIASAEAIPLEAPPLATLPTAAEIGSALAKTGAVLAEAAPPVAMIAAEAATPVLIGLYYGQKYAQMKQEFEMQQADAAYETLSAQQAANLPPPPPLLSKPTETARPTTPDLETPTVDELPRGPLVPTQGAPPAANTAPTGTTQPTLPPPSGGPPKFNPKDITGPIIGTGTFTAGKKVVDALRGEGDVAANGVKKIVKREWSPEEYTAWLDSLKHKPTPTNAPEDIYEIIHTGDTNYLLQGNGAEYWADGIENRTVLDAKMVVTPGRSVFLEDSKAPDFIKQKVEAKLRNEFERASKILRDGNNPLTSMRIITNDPKAVPYFEKLMREFQIPGEVVVRTATDIEPQE